MENTEVWIEPRNRPGGVDLGSLFSREPALYYERALFALEDLFSFFLKQDDVVTILTTSGSLYVSSCVTNAVERFGSWSRVFEEKTRVVVVVHEWGMSYPNLEEVRARCTRDGILLVEDCAYATAGYLSGKNGQLGDFTVVSLKKFFGSPLGGLLIARCGYQGKGLPLESVKFDVLPPEEVQERRNDVWKWYLNALKPAQMVWPACVSFLSEEGAPGVFLYPYSGDKLRDYLRANGVECGYWYGNKHLFLPCHQEVTRQQVERVSSLIQVYRKNDGGEH